MSRAVAVLALCLASVSWPCDLAAQASDVRFELDAGGSDWVDRRHALTLRPSRPLTVADGRLVVVIGKLDLTDLFDSRQGALAYRPELLPLPIGEHELVVYLVRGAEWREALRSPLRVLLPGGLERAQLQPTVELQTTTRLDDAQEPEGSASLVQVDEGTTAQLGLAGGLERDGWMFAGSAGMLGVSAIERALRFGELGEEADRLDLSSYLFRLERQRSYLELGHLTYGAQRHLVNAFATRGLHVGAPLGKAMQLRALAANGTSVVGFDNFSGLASGDHQVLSGTLALELLPQRPGALALEGTYLDGSLQPQSGFNQGTITDAERSEGWSLRLAGQPHRRLRLDAAVTGSLFANPFDPLLAQGGDLVPVEDEDCRAYYVETELLLLERPFGEAQRTNVSLALQHERVEPQYRSVVAPLQADLEQSSARLTSSVGPLLAQVTVGRAEDNLDGVPSILTTQTRRGGVNVVMPFPALWPAKPKAARALPAITYAYDHTRQLGVSLPINGGFSASHLPDQVNDNHAGTLDWQGARWRFGYQVAATLQDNRQNGRELADFSQRNHRLALDLVLHSRFDVGLSYGREQAESVAENAVQLVRRPSIHLLWRASDRLQLLVDLALTESEGPTARAENEQWMLEASYRRAWRAERRHGAQGQLFLRYSDQSQDAIDVLFGIADLRESWVLSFGLNVGLR